MPQTSHHAVADDIRPLLIGLAPHPGRFAIATLVAADGPSPREVGAQMLITETEQWGFLSGGCVEDDVARHAREVIAGQTPRLLRYGEGSPWIDIKLACGAGISILVEPAALDDPAVATLLAGYRERRPVLWQSDGAARSARFADEADAPLAPWDGQRFAHLYEPPLRLVIIGSDAGALALAALALHLGLETVLVHPGGPAEPPLDGIDYRRSSTPDALPLDRWTAVAVVTHDRDGDERMLAAALASDAFYVGAIGARSRLHTRVERLKALGIGDAALERLRAPIGLHGFGKAPRDIALSIVSDVKREFHSRAARARSAGVSMSSAAPSSVVGR